MTFKDDFKEGMREGYATSKTFTPYQKMIILCVAFFLVCTSVALYLAFRM